MGENKGRAQDGRGTEPRREGGHGKEMERGGREMDTGRGKEGRVDRQGKREREREIGR